MEGCRQLEHLTMKGYDQVPAGAFSGCRGLREVWLCDGITQIGNVAFNGCTALEKIRLPNGLKRIGNDAFFDCRALKRIDLPQGLEQIEPYAFGKAFSLDELIIPDSVTFIGQRAFFCCTSLRHVQLPDPLLEMVDDSAFWGTPFLQDRERAGRRSKALLVFLGNGAGNTAKELCKRMNCRQDMLFLHSALISLTMFYEAIQSMPGPALEKPCVDTILLGKTLIQGSDASAGGDPQLGMQSLREAECEIRAMLEKYRFVIVVTNLGGGTGSSVTLLAQWLREMDISHTVIAGTPFGFEGKRKMEIVQSILSELRESPLIEVSYKEIEQRANIAELKITLANAFELADQEVCRRIEQLLAQNRLQ